MANTDQAYGFRFAYTTHGGPPRITKHLTTGTAIYQGDAVQISSGRVLPVTDGVAPMGIAQNYCAATADLDVYVMDLSNTVFTVQADGSDLSASTIVGGFYDIMVATGNTTTLKSLHELDSSDSTADNLEVIGLVETPDNAWGEFAKVYVRFHVDTNAALTANAA